MLMRQSTKKLSNFLNLRMIGYFILRFKWVLGFFINKRVSEIQSPVFILGNQGDGLTLLSRVLRRNKSFVTVSGNSNYWTGADEMAIVMEPLLAASWRSSGFFRRDVVKHKLFRSPRSWTYATDNLIGYYRKDYGSVTDREKSNLLLAIRSALAINGKGKRFLDKSQLFTVKAGAINECLKESNPYFLLVLRNPYASIVRAAENMERDDLYKGVNISFEAKLRFAAQHWKNAMLAIEEDAKRIPNFKWVKIEEFLENPEIVCRELCDFLGVQFDPLMLPSENDKVPYFTRYNLRWYPLRTSLNDRYLKKLNKEYEDIINSIIKDLPHQYGYTKNMY